MGRNKAVILPDLLESWFSGQSAHKVTNHSAPGVLLSGFLARIERRPARWDRSGHDGKPNLMVRPAADRRAVDLAAQSCPEEYVCWSRMQAEAGQTLEQIVARKEVERRAGNGVFMWGVGNAPALVTSILARTKCPVRAVFSVMKSKPKAVDAAPARTVVWRRFLDAEGVERPLPPHVVVTSRGDSASGAKRVHYALMCRSDKPLHIERPGRGFDPSAFRNASGAGAPVGASQVTALLRRVGEEGTNSPYEVNLSAQLVGSYWVRLTDPVEVTRVEQTVLEEAVDFGVDGWLSLAAALRRGSKARDLEGITGLLI